MQVRYRLFGDQQGLRLAAQQGESLIDRTFASTAIKRRTAMSLHLTCRFCPAGCGGVDFFSVNIVAQAVNHAFKLLQL